MKKKSWNNQHSVVRCYTLIRTACEDSIYLLTMFLGTDISVFPSSGFALDSMQWKALWYCGWLQLYSSIPDFDGFLTFLVDLLHGFSVIPINNMICCFGLCGLILQRFMKFWNGIISVGSLLICVWILETMSTDFTARRVDRQPKMAKASVLVTSYLLNMSSKQKFTRMMIYNSAKSNYLLKCLTLFIL